MGKIWQRSLARSQSRGCRNGSSESEIFGMSLLGRVLSPHLGCSSFSQRHCWATTVHGSHKMQPLSLLWFYLPGESPCLALHSSQCHPGVPQLSPTPLSVSPPQLQPRIGFVLIPNCVFSLSPFLSPWELKSEKYIDLRN